MTSLLGSLRSLLHRLAPEWHPTRWVPVRRAIGTWVARRRPKVLPTRHGFNLYVPPEDRSPIVVSLYLDGEYEPEETRAVQEFVREGDVVVDVGANVGYVTCVLARAVGKTGAVHAFEPERRHFAALQRNVEINGLLQVKCVQKALSDSMDEVPLYLDRENPGDHTLVKISGRETIHTLTVPFDDYWRDCCEERPVRLIKIDVQGHEPKVLRGMSDTLDADLVEAILIEVWPHRLRQAGSSSDELLGLLLRRGWSARILASTMDTPVCTVQELLGRGAGLARDPNLSFNLWVERRRSLDDGEQR